MIDDIFDILSKTKDSQNLPNPTNHQLRILQDVGTYRVGQGWVVDRETRIQLGMLAIERGGQIEATIRNLTWKDFEGFIARILEQHDYSCVESFRRRGKEDYKGMEIDVIGLKGKTFLVVDAKMWDIRKGKSSALRNAADKQLERTERLCSEMGVLSQKIGSIDPGTYTLLPLLVTWVVEEVEFHEGIPIVPIFKFNNFIMNFYNYSDMIVSRTCRVV